jgi:hypothetical protein
MNIPIFVHSNRKRRFLALLLGAFGLLAMIVVGARLRAQEDRDIDWNRARQLHQRVQRGEKLSPEDQAYYERARRAFNSRQNQNQPPPQGGRESMGLTPLTELGKGAYKQESGGLYGAGRNEPPPAHLSAARREAAQIRPLDAQGRPSPDGKIVLLSLGMSNTAMEFTAFQPLANRDPQKSPQVVLVNGAQGGKDAEQWTRAAAGSAQVWDTVDANLKSQGVTPEQVQAIWIKQALAGPARYGEFPGHVQRLEKDLNETVRTARERFPHLRLAYLSSRIYAGYANTPLNPEPYAYEGAFAIRRLIDAQIKGDPALNHDPAHGAVKAPLLLWGPYLWADGVKPRKMDGLVWKREDLGGDGTHPSDSGRRKVAESLLRFFKTDPTARPWFLREPNATAASSKNP